MVTIEESIEANRGNIRIILAKLDELETKILRIENKMVSFGELNIVET